MNKDEFIVWLRGFLDAIPTGHAPNWDILKKKFSEIDETNYPNPLLFPPGYPLYPSYPQPLDPMYGIFKVTCGDGTTSNSTVNTTHVITFKQNVPSTLT